MRPSILIATAVSGVVIALAVVALMKAPPSSDVTAPPPPTVTGRQPAFHLDATPGQKRAILEAEFAKIASDRAGRLGTLKDDLALLLDDPEAVRYVVSQWHQRRSEGRYADAAFADIFRLVKNAEFVEPTAQLLAHERPEIRGKALQAAETQADPRLGPAILAIYRAAATDRAGKTGGIKFDALRAALACGGDALAALALEAFRDEGPEVAIQAMTIASDLEIAGAEAAAKLVLESSKDRRVRLNAAALLARRGDLKARDEIARALDPMDAALAADALHLVAKYRMEHTAPALRELRAKNTGEIRRLADLALLRISDRPTWDDVLQAADTVGGEREVEALQLLAASGDPDAVPILLHGIARGGEDRVRAIAIGIATSREPALQPVVEKLIEQPVGHPADLDEAPRVGGPALVPRLAQLLREATEPATQARYLAWLAMIGGNDARNVMLRERSRLRRIVDDQIRLVDLEARRLGREAPPLPR